MDSSLNIPFLETFKSLEAVCNDIYRAHNGVTCYIDEMSSISLYEAQDVPGWQQDLRQLKRLRHIRNQMTHEPGAMLTPMCTVEDIRWLANFHRRILDRADPLALLRRARRSAPSVRIPASAPQKRSGCAGIFLAMLLALLGVLVCLVIL